MGSNAQRKGQVLKLGSLFSIATNDQPHLGTRRTCSCQCADTDVHTLVDASTESPHSAEHGCSLGKHNIVRHWAIRAETRKIHTVMQYQQFGSRDAMRSLDPIPKRPTANHNAMREHLCDEICAAKLPGVHVHIA